jgi:hypothetical protein
MPPRQASIQLGLYDNPVCVFSLEELGEAVRMIGHQCAWSFRRRDFAAVFATTRRIWAGHAAPAQRIAAQQEGTCGIPI